MSKKILTNIKKLFSVLFAVVFCFGNFICIHPKAAQGNYEKIGSALGVEDERLASGTNDDSEKILSDLVNESKKGEPEIEGKWRKIGRFLVRRGFYFLLGIIAPNFHLSQSDLAYAESLVVGYILWKLSGDICSLVGLKDRKTREYTLKNISKKAANLLIRLGSMVAINKAVPKSILHDNTMCYISESIDTLCDDMTPEDRQNIKNIANRGITLSEGGIRYCCFSYLAKFIPRLLGC